MVTLLQLSVLHVASKRFRAAFAATELIEAVREAETVPTTALVFCEPQEIRPRC
jgi:hypothetical protein